LSACCGVLVIEEDWRDPLRLWRQQPIDSALLCSILRAKRLYIISCQIQSVVTIYQVALSSKSAFVFYLPGLKYREQQEHDGYFPG